MIEATRWLERVHAGVSRNPSVTLVGALLMDQNDEWAIQRHYMTPETLAPPSLTDHASVPAVAH